MTVGEAIRAAAARLQPASESARLDAELLMAEVRGCNRARLLADGRDTLLPDQAAKFDALVSRRAGGEPVAYLRGRREFWGLDLAVNAAVLDPRPDTECLVEAALDCLGGRAEARILDLGTGSGAVALALASECPDASVVAVDRSPAAAEVAHRNARRLGLATVRIVVGDWLAPLSGQSWDLVVSNPPYVAPGDPHLSSLRHEPREALVAGDDGYACLQQIIDSACPRLAAGGWLWLEHGAGQGPGVRARLEAAGLERVHTRRDAGGRERASGGCRA